MGDFENIFSLVYKKYYAKDYFGIREVIKNQLKYCKMNNIGVKYSEVKRFLLSEREKAYNMMLKRIQEKKEGKIFPKREKFTWEIFNKMEV